ncbi:MAG: hypothetical protein P4L81_07085, partial [Candidatus Pacebacteria bacterium]|nr:hypothetical protein [Candidatus Paceibacterota bacterium]
CIKPCARDACPVKQHLHLPSFFHLYLFAQHIIAQGQTAFEEVMRTPEAALQFLPTFSVASSLVFQALFHPTMLAFHAAKIRMIVRISFPYQLEQSSILPGFLAIYNNFLIREYRSQGGAAGEDEGAISPVQHLPIVTAPTRFDQYWIVDHDCMKVKHAPGLVIDDAKQTASAEKKRK